jgi:hypothetical protein
MSLSHGEMVWCYGAIVPWLAFVANKFHPLFVEVGQNCSLIFLQGPRRHATNCLFQTHKSIHPQNMAGSLACGDWK